MQVVARLEERVLQDVPRFAQLAEESGCDAAVSNENRHDAFLPLVLAAEHTERLRLGTSVAIAFPRSPMVVAQEAWDLQRFSNGRLQLGLGTQVKGHNERRFSVPWSPPLPRLREYVLALRAIWDTFQNGTRLDFRGDHYTFTLMTPFFNPGPLEHPHIPVYLAGVNPGPCRLAGEVADGLLLHPMSSPRYVREVVWPAIGEGAGRAGRSLEGFHVTGGGFVVVGRTEEERRERAAVVKRRIAFYASTRSYQPTMAIHGWGEVTPELHRMSLQGQWDAMADLITDEMLETFAVIGDYPEIGRRLRERWDGAVTRVLLSTDVLAGADSDERQRMVRELKGEGA